MAILLQFNTENSYTVQQLADSTQIKVVSSRTRETSSRVKLYDVCQYKYIYIFLVLTKIYNTKYLFNHLMQAYTILFFLKQYYVIIL